MPGGYPHTNRKKALLAPENIIFNFFSQFALLELSFHNYTFTVVLLFESALIICD